MGTLKRYKCNECRYSKELHLGIGMLYPMVSDTVKDSIASGEFGEELRQAYSGCELPAVCPVEAVYACPECGHWDVFRDASVYEPTDPVAARKEVYGIKTVEEWGGIPYVMRHDVASGKYRLIARFEPLCPKCGQGMRAIEGSPESKLKGGGLKCPRCGSNNASIERTGCWD